MLINDTFSKVYVLNLDADLWKYELLKQKLAELNIEHQRFPAIDGNTIKEEFNYYKGRNLDTAPGFEPHKYGLFRSYGAFGVHKSYMTIFQDAIAHGYESIIVFQDDIYFHKDFVEKYSDFHTNIIRAVSDWQVLYLGASQVSWDGVDIRNTCYAPTKHTYGLFANAFSVAILSGILTELEKRNYQCDGVVRNVALKYHNRSFVCYPNLVIADLTKSRTMPNRNMTEYAKHRRWDLKEYDMDTKYY